MGITPKPPDQCPIYRNVLAFGDLEILSDLRHDIRTKKCKKISFFGGVFRNRGVMKRGEKQRKIFSIFGPIPILSVL